MSASRQPAQGKRKRPRKPRVMRKVELDCDQTFQCSWTLYSDLSWTDRQKIRTVRTIREFWNLFNHIPITTDIKYRTNLSFFKHDILPIWESDENQNGGKWSADLTNRREDVQDIWILTVLGLVGETMDPEFDEIVGVTLHLRKHGDRIAIWTRSCTRATQMVIGRRLQDVMQCDKIEFKSHKQALRHDSAYESPSLYVVSK